MSTGAVGSSGGAPASTGSAASTGVASSTGAAAFAWGDGWRNQMAIGSTDVEKELRQLERYSTPEDVWRKARELERRLSSGELRSTLKKDATSQEVAQWRKDNGIPEKPEDYKVNMPQGKKAPASDDPFLKALAKAAHDSHYNQGQFDTAVSSFYAEVDRQSAALDQAEQKAVEACEEELRKAWGQDYRINKQMAQTFLERAPAGFRDRFLNGYLSERNAEGVEAHMPVKASPDAWKFLAQMEREINPTATVVPAGTTNVGQTIAAEKAELIKKSQAPKGSADYKHYWEGPGEARYRDLVAAEEKLKAKAA